MSNTIKQLQNRKKDIQFIIDDIKNNYDEDLIKDCFELSDSLYNFIKSSVTTKMIEKFYTFIETVIELGMSLTIDTLKTSKEVNKEFIDYFFDGIKIGNIVEKKLDPEEEEKEEIDEIDQMDQKNEVENIENVVNKKVFDWRPSQLEALKAIKENDFNSGLLAMITGAGKSFIFLKMIQDHVDIKKPKKDSLYILTCPRMDIFRSLFFKLDDDGDYVKDDDKIQFWKDSNIIDLTKFKILDRINNKNKTLKLSDKKLNLLVVNTQFLLPLYTDKDTKKILIEKTNLIVIDECHCISGKQIFSVIDELKYDHKINIIGFSATPIRNTNSSESNSMNIFSKTMDSNDKNKKINLIYCYDLIKGITEGIVLPYKIKCVKINKIRGHKLGTSNKEILNSILSTFIKTEIKILPYKKFIIWTSRKDLMRQCYKYIEDNFKDLKVFCTSSFDDEFSKEGFNTNYEEFYKSNGKSVLVCINKCKEGSDIPKIDCGIYFDGVKNRSILVCIQTSGRIIRPDEKKLKTHGHLIDTFILDEKDKPQSLTAEKIISYLSRLLNLADDDYVDEKEFYKKMLELANNMEYDTVTKTLKIKTDKNSKNDVIVELDNEIKMTTYEMDWSYLLKQEIIRKIDKKFGVNGDEKLKHDIESLKKDVRLKKIKDKIEYNNWADKYNREKEPNKLYIGLWQGWYNLFDIKINKFPKDKNEWVKKCKEYKLTNDNYFKKCDSLDMPRMPEDLYNPFINIEEELGEHKKEFRRRT
jgi:superfamily II DNA or RNA helicase